MFFQSFTWLLEVGLEIEMQGLPSGLQNVRFDWDIMNPGLQNEGFDWD